VERGATGAPRHADWERRIAMYYLDFIDESTGTVVSVQGVLTDDPSVAREMGADILERLQYWMPLAGVAEPRPAESERPAEPGRRPQPVAA
jgi:hypothetical protein